MTNTENAPQPYYRTGKGKRRHASYYCANSRRSVFTGDPVVIPAAEVANWAACGHCCDPAEVLPAVSAPAPADVKCKNSGVTNPRRMYSTCKDCGKEGAVNRNTGTLRAHKPKA
jgi:hypothetical protein